MPRVRLVVLPIVLGLIGALATRAEAAPARDALADPSRFRDRVHVADGTRAGFDVRPPAEPIETGVQVIDEELVVEERADAVRVMVEDDDARLLLWVPRADLAWTVARATRVFGRGPTGVWVLPGAPLAIDGAGKRVAVTHDDGNVRVRGTIARDALVHTFRATAAPRGMTHHATQLHREPGGPLLLHAEHGVNVRVLGHGPRGWRLVEHVDRYVRAVGWARAADLSDETAELGGIAGGIFGGSTHAARLELAPGTCLYSEAGLLVGVHLDARVRDAHRAGDGRWSVAVGMRWGARDVYVHETHGGADPPRFERCD